MRRVSLAVFDLDNTLYDWYSSFVPAIYAMIDVVVQTFRCDREALLDELRDIHRKYHDVEHPFSIVETPTIQAEAKKNGEEAVWNKLDPAFHAFNRVRKHNLSLFPGVRDTLFHLTKDGIKLVAFTDSSYHSTLRRIRQLELDDFFQHVFCRGKTESVAGRRASEYRDPPPEPLAQKTIELPPNESKPAPSVLIDIARREKVALEMVAYIGDSISRDVLMAKKAGCFAVWAKYGVRRDPQIYERLIRISHWSDQDISRERRFSEEAAKITPDFVCENSITELLAAVSGPKSQG